MAGSGKGEEAVEEEREWVWEGGITIWRWEEEGGDRMAVADAVAVATVAWGEMEETVGGIGRIEFTSWEEELDFVGFYDFAILRFVTPG